MHVYSSRQQRRRFQHNWLFVCWLLKTRNRTACTSGLSQNLFWTQPVLCHSLSGKLYSTPILFHFKLFILKFTIYNASNGTRSNTTGLLATCSECNLYIYLLLIYAAKLRAQTVYTETCFERSLCYILNYSYDTIILLRFHVMNIIEDHSRGSSTIGL